MMEFEGDDSFSGKKFVDDKRERKTAATRRSINKSSVDIANEQCPDPQYDRHIPRGAVTVKQSCDDISCITNPFCSCRLHSEESKKKLSALKKIVDSQLTGVDFFAEAEGHMRSYIGKDFHLKAVKHMVQKSMKPTKIIRLFKYAAESAMKYSEELGNGLPCLSGGLENITLRKFQCCVLLANAFLCCFKNSRFTTEILHTETTANNIAKLNMFLIYFTQLGNSAFKGKHVTFIRNSIIMNTDPSDYYDKKICSVTVFDDDSKVEDSMGEVFIDFANKYIGGGALSHGTAQEEILFLKYPEALIAILICPTALTDSETVRIIGSEQFVHCNFIGNEISCETLTNDRVSIDSRGRAFVEIIGIDAMQFTSKRTKLEFSAESVNREIIKAYAGFKNLYGANKAISTGHWGCGVFKGDKELKALIQVVAASIADRNLIYHCIEDVAFARRLRTVATILKENVKTGKLWEFLSKLQEDEKSIFDSVIMFFL